MGATHKGGSRRLLYPSRPSAHITPTPSLPTCLRHGVRLQYSSRLVSRRLSSSVSPRVVRCCVAVRYPHQVSTKDPKQSLGPTRMSHWCVYSVSPSVCGACIVSAGSQNGCGVEKCSGHSEEMHAVRTAAQVGARGVVVVRCGGWVASSVSSPDSQAHWWLG